MRTWKGSLLAAASMSAALFLATGAHAQPMDMGMGMHHHGYLEHNLVSDDTTKIPADFEDPNLMNAWGVAFFLGSPFWINDNATGLATLYLGDGSVVSASFIPIIIPTPSGTGTSAPTGIVANNAGSKFPLSNKMSAAFIFDTEDGTLSAWNLPLGHNAELEKDNSAVQCSNGAKGAVYKGLAMGTNATGVFLYATNFRCGTIDVFDSSFAPATLSGDFSDPQIPSGYAPFGIANVLGNLVVTYALQNSEKHDDVAGPGNGFVDIFDTNGNLIRRFARRGHLNSPWGIALAPFDFGELSGDLLIGDFGDGIINAYDPKLGLFVDEVEDKHHQPITIDGLWTITFGGAAGSDPGTLYFTAGPNGEVDGLFGKISPR